jgi:hypothetical protein
MTPLGSRAPAVTPMSHRVLACARAEGSARLARRSLTAVSMAFALLAAGCIVADPPDSSDPEKTPPVLLLGQADPSVYQLQVLSKSSGETTRVPINVPVRSEDAGDPLIAALYLNWDTPGQESTFVQGTQRRLEASTFDDTGRSVATEWDYHAATGCKQLTLIVTHETNFDWLGSSYVNPADIAIAVWFFYIRAGQSDTNDVTSCPNSSGAVQ